MKIKRYIFVILLSLIFVLSGCFSQPKKPVAAPNPAIPVNNGALVDAKIQVEDQALKNGTVRITKIEVENPGWLVVRRDEAGFPGAVVSFAVIKPGDYSDFLVPLDSAKFNAQAKMYATLLVDQGQQNVFEFPGSDIPAKDGDKEMTVAFTLSPQVKVDIGTKKIKEIKMTAQMFLFEPSSIAVNRGDTVRLNIRTLDIDHSIEIPGYSIKKMIEIGKTAVIEFVADTAGVFPFRQYLRSGNGFDDMKGELIVKE